MGRRKEREHTGKWFACCPDATFLSSGDFRAFHCGHLKAGSGLGQNCKALAAPVGLWIASSQTPNGRHILVGYTLCARALYSLQGLALVLVEEPSYALSWLHGRP